MNGQYLQLDAPVEYELEEKRSRFICYLYPVTSREQALHHLKLLQTKFPDARHHCWAYVIGDPLQPLTQAYSDDGEPSGTAGKPILNVLTQRGAGDSCAIVVRYFGGVKLGAGGLVRAYGGVVSKALDHARLTPQIPQSQLLIEFPFAQEAQVRHALDKFGGSIVSCEYSQAVTLETELDRASKPELVRYLAEITSGEVIVIDSDEQA